MKLLLDQGLPRSTGDYLGELGIEAIHVSEKGLSTASDSTILRFGREEDLVVVRWTRTSILYWRSRERVVLLLSVSVLKAYGANGLPDCSSTCCGSQATI